MNHFSGNDYLVQLSQFTALYKMGQQMVTVLIDLSVLPEYRNIRFQESINNNPYFFNAPFSGVVASPAAWSFIYRFMANKSEEYPMGLLNGEVLKSFYSITGDYPNFQYNPGYEKIQTTGTSAFSLTTTLFPTWLRTLWPWDSSTPNSSQAVATQARQTPLPAWMLRT
jgi:hypothetical protein